MASTKARHPAVSEKSPSKTIETLARDPLASDSDRRTARSENFPVASLALPRPYRRPFRVIYAYCRGADNIADASPDTESALEALDIWQQQLEAAFDGKAAFPLFQRLQELIENIPLTKQPFLDLLVAFRRDQHQTIYDTRDELLDYCNYSAIPVGRMLLQLFGKDEERFQRQADVLCIGLQLTNFWQDLSRDRPRREYLPTEDLARFGLHRESLDYQPTPPALEKLIQYEVTRTLPYFHAAKDLSKMLRGRIGFEIELIRQGGLRILKKVSRKGARVFSERPALGRMDWLWITLRSLF